MKCFLRVMAVVAGGAVFSASASAKPVKAPAVVMVERPGDSYRGKDFPVCLELEKILNLPENEHAFGYRTKIKDIVFPKRYKNFEPVKWEPVSIEEVKKFFPEGYIDKVLAADRDNAMNFEKDWDGKGDFIFETAQVDYDNHPPVETMFRYRFPTMATGNCMFPQSAPNPYRENFNPSEKQGAYSSWGKDCDLFRYGGKVYSAEASPGYITITRPVSIGYQLNDTMWNVAEDQLCVFKKTNR